MVQSDVEITLEVDKWDMGWVSMSIGWEVGKRIALMGSARFPNFSLSDKIEKWQLWASMQMKVHSKEVESMSLKGGSLEKKREGTY